MTAQSLTSPLTFLTANMQYKITSAEGRKLTVNFTFDDGTVLTWKKMDLQPVGYDVPDEEGRIRLAFFDPMDDVKAFLENWMRAYAQGKEKTSQTKTLDSTLVNKNFTVKAVVETDVLVQE